MHRVVLAALIILAALIASCSSSTPAPLAKGSSLATPGSASATATPEQTATPEPPKFKCDRTIKIGLIGDYSGVAASFGNSQKRGFLLGLEYLAGPPKPDGTFKIEECAIQVIDRDDRGNAEQTTTAARQLIENEKVDLLVGTLTVAGTARLQSLALEHKKVLVAAPVASNDVTGKDFNEYTFRVSRNGYQDAISQCQYLTTKYKRFVQIAGDYATGRATAAMLRDSCAHLGGVFVADDLFAPQDTRDFKPYLDRALKSGAESLIVNWTGPGYLSLLNNAKEMGVFNKMAVGLTLADNATMGYFAPAIGQTGSILYHYTLPKNPANDFLIKEITARYKSPPELFDADGMNAAIMIVEGLKKAKGSADGAALLGAFEGLEFTGPKGKVFVRPEDHVAIQDMYAVKIVNVDDAAFKFFELVGTFRPEPPCLLPESLKTRCGKLPYGALSK
jgi:branched-chain amino acid transport system substrate-binding protein